VWCDKILEFEGGDEEIKRRRERGEGSFLTNKHLFIETPRLCNL
jgi:hypothetical protein